MRSNAGREVGIIALMNFDEKNQKSIVSRCRGRNLLRPELLDQKLISGEHSAEALLKRIMA